MSNRIYMVIQLVGTLLILAFMPGNIAKLTVFLVLWILTFKRLSKNEVLFFLIVCVFFTIMNVLSLKQGIFAFTHPDIWGMPFYELAMWGFYLLHTARMLVGEVPGGPERPVLLLAFLYSSAFGAIPDQVVLFIVTSVLLGVGLYLYHEKLDQIYVLYMVGLGAAIEYTGVWTGQWHYPGNLLGGVPAWFVTLWGGVGFFLRRLALPLVYRNR